MRYLRMVVLVVVLCAACRATTEPVASQTCTYTETIPATPERPAVIITGYYSGAVCDSLRAQFPGRVTP